MRFLPQVFLAGRDVIQSECFSNVFTGEFLVNSFGRALLLDRRFMQRNLSGSENQYNAEPCLARRELCAKLGLLPYMHRGRRLVLDALHARALIIVIVKGFLPLLGYLS